MQKIPAILLAAGLSSRMGAFKPLLRLGERTLLEHGIQTLLQSSVISEIIVVTGHRADEIRAALPPSPGLRLVFNANFAPGEMLSSVQTGIAALPADAKGFILAFADQPAVAPATIHALVERFRQDEPPLTLPTHGGKRGHPVLISATLIPEIQATRDPDTLKTVVYRHLPHVTLVEVPDASIHEDLDTPEDFARVAGKYPPRKSVNPGGESGN
jgi:molybdenum cofactor cytidylyltransferase